MSVGRFGDERAPAGVGMDHLMRSDQSLRLRRLRVQGGLSALLVIVTSCWLVASADRTILGLAGVLLVAISSASGASFVSACASQYQREPLFEIIRALLGDDLGVRSADRFLRRLRHECDRARRGRGAAFSILVMELDTLASAAVEARLTSFRLLQLAVRSHDVVGDSGSSQAWVLLPGADEEGATQAFRRLTALVERELGLEPVGGPATFGADGRTPEALLAAARRRAALAASSDVA